jgi:hypothetical protein
MKTLNHRMSFRVNMRQHSKAMQASAMQASAMQASAMQASRAVFPIAFEIA